jgi:hypothetical protein
VPNLNYKLLVSVAHFYVCVVAVVVPVVLTHGQKVLMQKCKTFRMGAKITCALNCNYRITATLFTLETLFHVYNSNYPA